MKARQTLLRLLPATLVPLLVMPGVVVAEDPSTAPTEGPKRRDLYLDMPHYLGGFEPEIVMVRGEEHFANLGSDHPRRIELEEMLVTLGADVEDMVSGYAAVSQEGLFGFVVALRVEGVEPGTLVPAYLPLLVDDLVDPTTRTGVVGGRDVIIISSIGDDDEYVDLFVYDQGDTLWMLQGPTDVIDVTLRNLPGPISRTETG